MTIEIHPVTADRWGDFEELFGANGACAGCWCMWWRKSRREWERDKGEGNRASIHALIDEGAEPGLIAYADGAPAGWVAVSPRADLPRMAGSRILKPVDDRPAWSISCLFVGRDFRRRGISEALVKAAADHAFEHGAQIVEGYPHDTGGAAQPDTFVWTGLIGAYAKAGFREVARRSPKRPMMRLERG